MSEKPDHGTTPAAGGTPPAGKDRPGAEGGDAPRGKDHPGAAEPRVCALIPAYNEEGHLAPVVEAALREVEKVFVVDDGSADRTAGEAERAGAEVIRHEVNRGKGAALSTGLRRALEEGFDAALTLDADGQHDPAEIPLFVEEYRRTGAAVVLGTRMYEREGMPPVRAVTNFVTSLVVSCIGGRRVSDSQSGFRLLDCRRVAALGVAGLRYDAEPELLVRAARAGHEIREVKIRTIYGAEQSKIHPGRDTCRFIILALRLIFLK